MRSEKFPDNAIPVRARRWKSPYGYTLATVPGSELLGPAAFDRPTAAEPPFVYADRHCRLVASIRRGFPWSRDDVALGPDMPILCLATRSCAEASAEDPIAGEPTDDVLALEPTERILRANDGGDQARETFRHLWRQRDPQDAADFANTYGTLFGEGTAVMEPIEWWFEESFQFDCFLALAACLRRSGEGSDCTDAVSQKLKPLWTRGSVAFNRPPKTGLRPPEYGLVDASRRVRGRMAAPSRRGRGRMAAPKRPGAPSEDDWKALAASVATTKTLGGTTAVFSWEAGGLMLLIRNLIAELYVSALRGPVLRERQYNTCEGPGCRNPLRSKKDGSPMRSHAHYCSDACRRRACDHRRRAARSLAE